MTVMPVMPMDSSAIFSGSKRSRAVMIEMQVSTWPSASTAGVAICVTVTGVGGSVLSIGVGADVEPVTSGTGMKSA